MTRMMLAMLCPSSAHFIISRYLPCFQVMKLHYHLNSRNLLSKRRCDTKLPLRPGGCKLVGGLVDVGHRSLSIRATTQFGNPESIDSPLMWSMEKKIKEHLNAELVTVKDAYGDGRHVSINVIASAFEGQSPVNRQRMVYKAIWEELQNTVHAVDQMTTKTPKEAAEASDYV